VLFENVSRLCEEQNLSISALEKAAGLGNGTIRLWKVSYPKVNNLAAVASVLGTTIDELLK
jgi:transcriptional regulator with XRE-family HTH domain